MQRFQEFIRLTRKLSLDPPKPSPSHINYRKLDAPDVAFHRILGNWVNPNPGERNGRNLLLRNLIGPAVNRWHHPHLRSVPGLWYWKSEEERYWMAKSSFLRSKGRSAPKKGSGKKALKRLSDSKKAAAKAGKKI